MLQGTAMGLIPVRREAVTTDAPLSGWGAVWQSQAAQGQWSALGYTDHINVLELRAVHLALRHFIPCLRRKHVLVRLDNIPTVSYINHQGGTKSVGLLRATRDLLVWAAPRLTS